MTSEQRLEGTIKAISPRVRARVHLWEGRVTRRASGEPEPRDIEQRKAPPASGPHLYHLQLNFHPVPNFPLFFFPFSPSFSPSSPPLLSPCFSLEETSNCKEEGGWGRVLDLAAGWPGGRAVSAPSEWCAVVSEKRSDRCVCARGFGGIHGPSRPLPRLAGAQRGKKWRFRRPQSPPLPWSAWVGRAAGAQAGNSDRREGTASWCWWIALLDGLG